MGREASPRDYDRLHETTRAWQPDVHPNDSPYGKLLSTVAQLIPSESVVLDVGCGSGTLYHYKPLGWYHGFDFSPIAIRNAIKRTLDPNAFSVRDARDPRSYERIYVGADPRTGIRIERPYDVIACVELLEHVDDDLKVVANWRPGCQFVASVPSFDNPVHVRCFGSPDDIRRRYGELLDIETVEIVRPPLFRGRTIREAISRIRDLKTEVFTRKWFVFSGWRR